MKRRAIYLVLALCTLYLGGCGTQAQDDASTTLDENNTFEPGTLNPDAPPETAQFGQLVGVWDITDETLQSDGTWKADSGAEWIWYYVLDGHAIQDDWIAPARHVPTAETPRQYGTNLRIYDPAAERWDLAWISNTDRKLSTFTATMQDDALVMRGTTANGQASRITFFDITPTTFEWKLELGQEDGSWTEVYRIHGVRRQ